MSWQHGLRFRTWLENEVRSPHPQALQHPEGRFNTSKTHYCPASECLLVSKDMWVRGLGKIYMNPRVQVYYNDASWWLQRFFMPLVNSLFYRWYNALTLPAVRPVVEEVGSAGASAAAPAPPSAPVLPPLSIECGLEKVGDVGVYSLVVFGLLWITLLYMTVVGCHRLLALIAPNEFADVIPLFPFAFGRGRTDKSHNV